MCVCVCASTCPFAHVRSRCRNSTESMSHLKVDLEFLEVFTQLEHLSVTFRDGSLQRLLILRHHCCRVLRANRWIFTPLSLSRSRACMYACVHIFACTRLQVCDACLPECDTHSYREALSPFARSASAAHCQHSTATPTSGPPSNLDLHWLQVPPPTCPAFQTHQYQAKLRERVQDALAFTARTDQKHR